MGGAKGDHSAGQDQESAGDHHATPRPGVRRSICVTVLSPLQPPLTTGVLLSASHNSNPPRVLEQITSKNLPLHVDSIAERKRRQYEECARSLNDGMGCSAVTWLRNRSADHPANHAPWRSAGANHPPRTAKGLVQNIRPGLTRPRSAYVPSSRLDQGLYSNRGTENKGFLVKTEAMGTKDGAHQHILNEFDGQDNWQGTWPAMPSDNARRMPVAPQEKKG